MLVIVCLGDGVYGVEIWCEIEFCIGCLVVVGVFYIIFVCFVEKGYLC